MGVGAYLRAEELKSKGGGDAIFSAKNSLNNLSAGGTGLYAYIAPGLLL